MLHSKALAQRSHIKVFDLFQNSKSFNQPTTSSQLQSFSNTFFFIAGRTLLFSSPLIPFSNTFAFVAGRLVSSLHILLFAGELPPITTSISQDEFDLSKMSFTSQSTTARQQPARGRTGNAPPFIDPTTTQPQQPARGQTDNAPPKLAQVAVQRMPNSFQHHSQAIMHHHVEGLVVSYLETNPGLFAGLLQKHEVFLAQYVRAYYNVLLPTRKSLRCPLPTFQPANAKFTVAKPQSKPSSPAKLPSAHASNYQPASSDTPQAVKNQRPVVEFTQISKYQRSSAGDPQANQSQPLATTSSQIRKCSQPTAEHLQTSNCQRSSTELPQTTNYEPPSVENGDSPQSTSSQLNSNWPTEEDLNVPFPAPDKYLDREAGLNRGKGYKWTFHEQDLAIEAMFMVRNDPTVPRTEKRFEKISRILMERNGIERSKDSVKNMWNRIGRHRSKYDERKTKSSQLATSQQGKQARMEHEAKRNGKRKASAEPEQRAPKKSKPSSTSKPSSVSMPPSMSMPSPAENDSDFGPYALPGMPLQEMARSNASLDASLDALFSGTDDQASSQFIDPRDLHFSYPAQPELSSKQGMLSTTASASACPELPPTNAVNQIQPPAASRTQDVTPAIASPVRPGLPNLVEEDPSPESHYTSDEDFAKVMRAELNTMDDFGQVDGINFNNNAYGYSY